MADERTKTSVIYLRNPEDESRPSRIIALGADNPRSIESPIIIILDPEDMPAEAFLGFRIAASHLKDKMEVRTLLVENEVIAYYKYKKG